MFGTLFMEVLLWGLKAVFCLFIVFVLLVMLVLILAINYLPEKLTPEELEYYRRGMMLGQRMTTSFLLGRNNQREDAQDPERGEDRDGLYVREINSPSTSNGDLRRRRADQDKKRK